MPLISCLMPTYNKLPKSQELVEEAVESFLRQHYPEDDAELLICNDCPQQTIVFDHPRVRIENLGCRFDSLGEKLNYMIEQARGDYITRWDDDDISLPWRIRYCVDKMVEHDLHYYVGGNFWATNKDRTSYEGGAYAQCMFTKTLAQQVRHESLSFAEDRKFEWAAKAKFPKQTSREKVPMEATFYLYRWNTGSEHLSGYGQNGSGWERIGQRPVQAGTYELNPHWREDYVARVQRRIAEYVEDSKK